MSQHTKGPWETETGKNVWDKTRGWTICTMNQVAFGEQGSLANARLIAAAPELLEACREMLNDDSYELGDESLLPSDHPKSMARAAIAKAEGREP